MKVAVAIILDGLNRILITQRPLHVPHGGLWEFPGGKLEPSELAVEALVREIREEIGLNIIRNRFLGEITHHYPDKTVQLLVFLISEFSGEPACLEGQLNMKWIDRVHLDPKDFPEANHAIIDLIPDLVEI